MNYHWAIINPEVYPSMFLKELDALCREFEEKYPEDIKKGCERHFCGLTSSKFTRMIQYKGFNKARNTYGTFTVDNPNPLSIDDFKEDEIKLAKEQGFDLNSPKEAWDFVQKNNLEEEVKKIPHYWTSIDKLIIDFTCHSQFVKSGMAKDNNIQRYERRIKEDNSNPNKDILMELGDSIYPYKWQTKSSEKGQYIAHFKSTDGGLIIFDAGIYDEKSDTWMVEFKKGNTYKATGEGDAFKIFSTVIRLIEEFVEIQKPKVVLIESDKIKSDGRQVEGSRSKLYQVMIKKLASKINYSLNVMDSFNYTSFLLQRKTELKETGDSYYPFKQTINNPDFIEFKFDTKDGRHVGIIFSASNDDNTFWGTAFDVDGNMGITNKGDQFKILSTIYKIMSLFIETKQPLEITFSADKMLNKSSTTQSTRTKIYFRAMNNLASKYNYKININKSKPYIDVFTLVKNNQLTEEINSDELGRSIRNKLIKYIPHILKSNTPGDITKIIRVVATSLALEIGKKHIKGMTKRRWYIEVLSTGEKQHYGEAGLSPDGYGVLKLFVSKPITQDYLSKTNGTEDEEFNRYWTGIQRFLSHEFLHIEQWLRSKGKQNNRKGLLGKLKNIDLTRIKQSSVNEYKNYLADKLEISAYALNAVQELQSDGIDLNKLYFNYLTKGLGDKKFWQHLLTRSSTLHLYWTLFKSKADDDKDIKVWNLFLKKFMFHLELRTEKE